MIFILNTGEEVIGTLARFGTTNKVTPYFDDNHIEDLSTGAETFTFSTFANTREASNIIIGNLIAFKVENGYKLFQITDVEEIHDEEFIKTAYCEMAGIELINEIVRAVNIPSASLKQFLTLILQDTEYQVGRIDGGLVDVHSIDLKSNKVYTLLQEYVIGKYGAEISFRTEIEGGRIVGKYVDCYAERGSFNGVRFEYGHNVTKVKKSVDSSELVTALIGEGKNGIDFKSIEAPDKPLNQDFIVDNEAYKIYNKKGNHIFDIYKYDTESPAELLNATREELKRRSTPKFKYEVDVETLGQKVDLGDTVYIVDNTFYPPLHLSARVSKLQKSRTDSKKDKCILANYKEVVSNITDEDRKLASLIDERFPIGTSDIKDGAVTGNKIPEGSVNSNHIIRDSITTQHLQANSITSDKIEAGQIKAEHILADAIKSKHIKADEIEAKHIKAEAIESSHIKAEQIEASHIQADAIETSHIKADQVVGSHILAGEIQTGHLKANAITSDKINANAISTDKIQANAVTSEKILAGSISTDKLEAGAITSDKIDANAITSEKIQANQILSNHIKAEQILASHIKAGEITADKIGANEINTEHLVANAITSDKIGANQVTANHIKAGSIDASKVTTGELITNSAQIKKGLIETAHIGVGQITEALIGNGAINEAKILDASITSAKIEDASITSAKIGEAQIETAHIKELSANKITSGKINTGLIEVAGTNGNLKIKDNRLQVFDKSEVPKERVSLGDVNGDGSIYGLRVRGADGNTILYDENGVYSEGITDGAITNPKIEDGSIDSRTLNLEELFVSDGAFINELKAVKINASQIEVDTIRNDLINLEGAIKFSSLSDEINKVLFVKPPNSGETWINGGMIATDTIKADSIDLLSGITVTKDGQVTFAIGNDGSGRFSGEVSSFNFSNVAGQEAGYMLDPNGTAYLNEAILRGSVILPQAGITNTGNLPSAVRFFAGTSYEDRENAPFLVRQDGSFKATKGEIGGTFTGELHIGNIHITDTNETQAEFTIYDNDNVNKKIELTDASANFNVDFSIGDVFNVNVGNKSVGFGDGVGIKLHGGKYETEFNKDNGSYYTAFGLITEAGSLHNFNVEDGYSGLHFKANGTKATAGSETHYDYKFSRGDGDSVSVVVDGRLTVKDKITMADDNKIELVSVSGVNSGIDFMIR
jgi:phage minor structural protein